MRDERGAIAFGEKVLALLDQGRFTATYKYAVLLGLIDLCLAGFTKDGRAPDGVTTPKEPHVDHFLPWARVPLDAVENLVAADAACNLHKRDFLASAEHVEPWSARLREQATALEDIAAAARWERAPERTLGVARALYLPLPPEARLWSAGRAFVLPAAARLRGALG